MKISRFAHAVGLQLFVLGWGICQATDVEGDPPLITILGDMVKRGNLDGELMRIFLASGDYLSFAREFLNPEQIDEVDIDQWLEKYYVTPELPGR